MAEVEQVKEHDLMATDSEGLTFPIEKTNILPKARTPPDLFEAAQVPEPRPLSEEKSALPEDRIDSAVNHAIDEDSKSAIEELEIRLARRLARRPVPVVELVGNALNSVFSKVRHTIQDEPSVMQFILSKVDDETPELLARMITTTNEKVFKEIERGVVLKDFWERQVDHMENRLKQVQGRDHMMKAILNRHEIKELDRAKQLEAREFSVKMQELAKEKAQKRRKDLNKREFEIMREQQKAAEITEQAKLDRINKHHAQAMNSLQSLKDRKKHRYRLYIEGMNRQKQIDANKPYYLQKNEEFRKQEEDRYYSHGRPAEEVEEFLKVKKSYHLTRNKMNLLELLYPGREMSANLGRSQMKSPGIEQSRIESSYLSRKVQNSRLNVSADPRSLKAQIQFAELPRLNFSKR